MSGLEIKGTVVFDGVEYTEMYVNQNIDRLIESDLRHFTALEFEEWNNLCELCGVDISYSEFVAFVDKFEDVVGTEKAVLFIEELGSYLLSEKPDDGEIVFLTDETRLMMEVARTVYRFVSGRNA